MSLGGWIARLAGGRDDVLRRTPTDRTRYIATGGVLLTTAAVAAVSAVFALHTAVGLSLQVAVAVGIAWGVVILNLDRLLITGMVRHREGGRLYNLWLALPRVGLALLLGAVISMPLVLQVFDREISAEVKVLQARQEEEFKQRQQDDTRAKRITELDGQIAALQPTANANTAETAQTDQAVKDAQGRLDRATTALNTALDRRREELEGQRGAPAGKGSRYEELDAAVRQAQTEVDGATTDRNAALEASRTAVGGAATSARQDIADKQKEADELRGALARERADYSARVQQSDGLLSRIEALNSLSANRPALALAHWTLFGLFLSIELLPVLVKLLQLFGPRSTYEKIIERMEADALSADARRRAREQEAVDDEEDRDLAMRLDWNRQQHDAGMRSNSEVTSAQEAVTQRAVGRWFEDSVTELDRKRRSRRPFSPDTGQDDGRAPFVARYSTRRSDTAALDDVTE